MEELRGGAALVTGASRGLGQRIARELAGHGMDLALAARSADALEELAEELERRDVRAVALPADLTRRAEIERLATEAESAVGGIDVLVNNAGVLRPFPYHRRAMDEIELAVRVNLLAPMLLARLLLPGMLERGRGHVLNMASLAGKNGPPYEEAYGATKAGLIGFTQSLRKEYHGTGVSASAICPGYVTGAGMYADAVEETGIRAPGRVGRASPDDVARAVVRAIRQDRPEVIVNSTPVRPLTVLSEAFPALGETLGRRLGLFRSFEEGARRAAEAAGGQS